METPVVSTAAPADPSFADLRKLLNEEPAAEAAGTPAADAPQEKTPEPAAEPAAEPESKPEKADDAAAGEKKADEAEHIEPAEGAGDKKQEPKDDEHVKLSPAAQKRLDREISRTVNARKEAEDIVKRLREKEAGTQGTQPVKAEPESKSEAASTEPIQPNLDDYKTFAEYQLADRAYQQAARAWLIAETRRTVTEELTAQQQKAADLKASHEAKKSWKDAVDRHGDEFPDLMQAVTQATPEGLQVAISEFDDWSGIAVHLAQNPKELASIVERFEKSPVSAIAELGRLEERLKPAPKSQPKEAEKVKSKPLPAPPAKVGGAPAPTASVDLEKADQRTFNREIRPYLAR